MEFAAEVVSAGALAPRRQARQVAPLVAWTFWGLSAVLLIIATILIVGTISAPIPSRGFGFRGWVPIVAAMWTTIGAIIAGRHWRNPVGWLVLFVGLTWASTSLAEEYATYALFSFGQPPTVVLAEATGQTVGTNGDAMVGNYRDRRHAGNDSSLWTVNDLCLCAELQAPLYTQALFDDGDRRSLVSLEATEYPWDQPGAPPQLRGEDTANYVVRPGAALIALVLHAHAGQTAPESAAASSSYTPEPHAARTRSQNQGSYFRLNNEDRPPDQGVPRHVLVTYSWPTR